MDGVWPDKLIELNGGDAVKAVIEAMSNIASFGLDESHRYGYLVDEDRTIYPS